MYTPDAWVVLEILHKDQVLYKVLGGWSGSYIYGSSWQLNSGIVRVEEDEDCFRFYGNSGSCYACRKGGYGLRMSIAGVANTIMEKFPGKVKILPEDTDWASLTFLPYDV